MTNRAGTIVGAALVASLGLVGLGAATAGAEELRIGFLAPMTGPFAQVGKDMVNGFEMYLEETKGNFGGATVKFIVETNRQSPRSACSRRRS